MPKVKNMMGKKNSKGATLVIALIKGKKKKQKGGSVSNGQGGYTGGISA